MIDFDVPLAVGELVVYAVTMIVQYAPMDTFVPLKKIDFQGGSKAGVAPSPPPPRRRACASKKQIYIYILF